MAESIVTLRVDTRNAVSSLNNATASTNKLSAASRGATKSLAATSSAAQGLGTALRNSIAPILAVGTAFSVVNNSIGTFLARERDIAILEQGLKNLGAGSFALNELQQVADKFGKTTLFNQEDFTRGFNLLTSFRNIGVDSYSRVAQAAADIAQVNQVDVSTSFMQLAKALQDPERNLSNLNRSGIAFTKQQTKVIKELMKTNQVAKAHTMILDIVDESYNKLAQAAAVGFAGSVDTLGEEFRDFGETIGKALIPVIDPAVKGLTALLNFLNSSGGQAAAIIGGIALAAKGLAVVLPILSTNFIAIKTSALIATGQLIGMKATLAATTAGFASASAAASAFKIALAKTGIGLAVIGLGAFITKLIEANNEQRTFNELLEQGSAKALKIEIADLEKEQEILNKQLEGTNRLLMGIAGIAGLDIFTRSAQDIKLELAEVNNKIAKLKEGLPNAEARDLSQQFKIQLDDLKKQNAELTNAVKREAIIGEEKRKEFDLEQKIAKIKEQNLKPTEEAQLINLIKANHSLDKQLDKTKKINEAAEKLKETFKEVGQEIEQNIKDNLREAITGAQSFGDAMTNVLNRIRDKIIDAQLDKLFDGFAENVGKGAAKKGDGKGIGGFIGGILGGLFAEGGNPPVGKPSIVGEKGPELFVPRSAGTIIPNNQMGGSVVVNVSVDASGSAISGSDQKGNQFGQELAIVIQQEIIRQKRSGGLLA